MLVTGLKGSGKSTTLYSMLQKINQSDVNIITVEDSMKLLYLFTVDNPNANLQIFGERDGLRAGPHGRGGRHVALTKSSGGRRLVERSAIPPEPNSPPALNAKFAFKT